MLCDYGLTLSTPEELPDHIYARPVGVARWMAPEIMATIAHEEVYGPPTGRTKQTDIYAYAMTILEVSEPQLLLQPADTFIRSIQGSLRLVNLLLMKRARTRSSALTMVPSRLSLKADDHPSPEFFNRTRVFGLLWKELGTHRLKIDLTPRKSYEY